MAGCETFQGLIAQSLYEDLETEDREALDRHLEACGQCRAEAGELGLLVKRIPVSAITLDRDLTPLLRASIEVSSLNRRRWGFALSFAAAAAAVVFAVGYGALVWNSDTPSSEGPSTASVQEESLSAAALRLAEARALAESRDYPGAFVVLKDLIEAAPADGLAGEAQRFQADIAFGELHWYPEALAAYESLQRNHPDAFASADDAWGRLELLAEARGDDGAFLALHELDAARAQGRFEGFEQLVERYPATYVASLAADDMARLALESVTVPPGASRRLYAMETALKRCTHPVAIAQLKVEMGHIYRNELNDADSARGWYEDVAQSGNTVLARLARESLGGLSGLTTP